jgi:hypothetical protein
VHWHTFPEPVVIGFDILLSVLDEPEKQTGQLSGHGGDGFVCAQTP